MKVFVTGATGRRRQLVPMLIEHGHEVVAMTRSPGKALALQAIGAEPVVGDGLDRGAVVGTIGRARPDAIVHQATALSGKFDLKHFDRFFAQTNRLRRGARTSCWTPPARPASDGSWPRAYAGWAYRSETRAQGEDEPFEADLPAQMRSTVEAMQHLEGAVLGAPDVAGVVLRYGPFYGPAADSGSTGTWRR